MFDNTVVVVSGHGNEKHGDDDHSFNSRVHRLLENVKVAIVLLHSFDVTLLVESASTFDIVFISLLI